MAIIKNIKLPNGDTHSLVDANYVHTDNNYTTTEKNKLAGVASGAEVNQNAFSNVAIGASTISADSKTDTLTLVGGANITLTPDATNDKITILLDDTVDTGEVIATDVQAGNLIVNGTSRFLNTINGTASDSEKLNGQSLTSTYSSTGTAPITGAAVASAIGALDGAVTGSPSASKTLTAFSQTDGKVSATFGNILITKSQVSDFPTLGTAAAKNYTTSVSSGSADLVTSGAVWTAIDNLPEPMVFKGSLGTGGTITALPVDGTATVGDTYKVITAGTYASKAAKVGDTFICLTKTSSANTWELIPSGDEPSGTVTSVAVSNGGGLSVSGSPITSSGTITISHADTSSQASVTNSGRTYIQSIGVDGMGHVTSISSATETVTDTNTWRNIKVDGTEKLGTGTGTGAIDYVSGNHVSLSYASNKLTIAHSDTSTQASVTNSGRTYIQSIGLDGDGHVTSLSSATETVTDTNYYHKTGSWNGLTYTAAKVGSPEDLAFTIPTGTTSTTVAAGNHTHATSIAASSGTNQLTLAANTKYSITAGGTSYIFTTPPDNDTKNTAGSTDTSSKIYLVGATSQAANPQTYSDNEVYATSGVLTTKSVQVGGGSATMEYSATTKSINFVFAS